MSTKRFMRSLVRCRSNGIVKQRDGNDDDSQTPMRMASRGRLHGRQFYPRWITGVILPVDAGLIATTPLAMLDQLR